MSLLSVVLVAATPHNSDPLPWQTSLSTCWTNASCNRALIVGHGGDPNFVTLPYGSLPSFERAVAVGADAVKGDYRAAEDGLGVVVHSSPIEIYESLDCAFRKPEKMAAAKVAECHMLPTNTTFITAATMLDWAKGKVNVMWCIKDDDDIAAAVREILAHGAQDRTFLEIRVGPLLQRVPQIANFTSVYYLAEAGSEAEIDAVLAAPAELRARIFTLELDQGLLKTVNVSATAARLHAAGIRLLAPTDETLATVAAHEKLWRSGIDVVYSYGVDHGVVARKKINEERGVTPA